MKKNIFTTILLSIVTGFCSLAQMPIATKDIGTDSLSGLEQRVEVWRINIDAKAESVVVVYNIVTLAPNGVVVATGSDQTYLRYNKEGDMRFNALRQSQIGQMITGMVANDLLLFPNLDQ